MSHTDLPRPDPTGSRRTQPQGVRQPIDTFTNTPALVLDRRNDILAWNPRGHLLLAMHLAPGAPEHPAPRPNLTRMLFLDDRTRDLYPHWQDEARLAMASLRLATGYHPHDKRLAERTGELTMNNESLLHPDASDPRVIAYSARFGAGSEAVLRLLAATLRVPDTGIATSVD
ncbi:hypothetical protein NX794_23905 [Streptomyces sp. LP11]|uniref:MmyB-like transcription regulator ligand binding domain-containing protein n=1 Tax=Streptomyces pyxinicus TaxID=2970331 RepID=A0ABT2B755_9ACTN|nr:hypothetical protein [Streptomyces sp. LP11]MCS0604235.1 hypothetical protein [Streptomyces sp. LP11]